MIFHIFLFQLFFILVASDCSDETDCFQCVRSQRNCPWCSECEWCSDTNQCEDHGKSTCPSGVAKSNCKDEFLTIAPYNETISRYLLDLAFAAYIDHPQKCLQGVQVMYRAKSQCDVQGGVCFAYIAVNPSKQAIILSFRGTQSPIQLMMEGLYSLGEYVVQGNIGGVMKYFKDGFDAIWPCLLPNIKTLQAEHPDYELWVTGHSLGGSLASVAAFEVSKSKLWPKEKLKLVTYGQPRTGNFKYAKEHDQLVPYSWRVVNNRDVVPHMPACGGFRGQCLMSTTQPYHHGMEVWYNNGMEPGAPYKECRGLPHNEDYGCSSGLYIKFSVLNHLNYFETSERGFCPSQPRNKRERIFSDKCRMA